MKTARSNGKRRTPEFDFSKGVRGKYAARYAGSNVVILAPDVARDFPDSKSVNKALRAIQGLAKIANAH